MKRKLLHLVLAVIVILSTAAQIHAVTVKFLLDMTVQIDRGKFNSASDKVFIKGTFDNWQNGFQMNREANSNIYSIELSLNESTVYEYKYYNTNLKADNGGWEGSVGSGYGGNRTLNVGSSNLIVPVVYFNNDELALNKSSEHFNYYCAAQDVGALNDLSQQLESNYSRIVSSLGAVVTQKINVEIYKDLQTYHRASGWPDAPDWAVGNAKSKLLIQMVSPLNPGPVHTYSSLMQVIVHELVHAIVAWKQSIAIPYWLNEGTAGYYSGQTPAKDYIKTLISKLGRKPEFEYLEDFKTFGDRGGYQFSYTIAEFVLARYGNAGLVTLIGNYAPTVLGHADKKALQAEWHQFLDESYLGLTGVEELGVADQFVLEQNYPNPFNPVTKIGYEIKEPAGVSLKVFDILGREITTLVDGFKNPGRYEVEFNASSLSNGVYLCRLQAGKFSQTKKIMLNK